MTDIVERLRGSPHTRCLDPMCFEGYQVCPHDEEEILEAEERLMEEAAKEIERLRAALREVDSQLMNMQPHIASLDEHCGNVGRTRFIDDHVDAALGVIRKALEAKDDRHTGELDGRYSQHVISNPKNGRT